MNIDLTHIIMTIREAHPEFSYEEISAVCEAFIESQKKVKKVPTMVKQLCVYVEKEFDVDMSSIDRESGWRNDLLHEVDKELKSQKADVDEYALSKLPLHLFQGESQKRQESLFSCDGVTLSYGERVLLDEVNLSVHGGQKIALMGANGVGKTSLLNAIRESSEDSEAFEGGNVAFRNGMKIGFLSQEMADMNADTSLMSFIHMSDMELYEAMSTYQSSTSTEQEKQEAHDIVVSKDGFRRWEMQTEILKYFGIPESSFKRPLKKFSGGQNIRIMLARSILQDVDILLLDEPTNHLDIAGIQFLEDVCAMWNKAMICISHDRRFLETVFDTFLEIEFKKIEKFSGSYEGFQTHKRKREEAQLRQFEAQEKFLKQQERFIERFRYKASKASQVQSRIKMLDKLDRIEAPQARKSGDIALTSLGKLPQQFLVATGLEIGYTSPICTLPYEITIEKSMKIGLIGANGAGKTTFLQALLGGKSRMAGTVEVKEGIRVGNVSQTLEGLDMNASILGELSKTKASQGKIRGMCSGFLLGSEHMHRKIRQCSGGERSKVAFIKMLLTNPHLLILDEPTNHLDLQTKEMMKGLLRDFEGSILLVSHDRDLLDAVCDDFWCIADKRLTHEASLKRAVERVLQ